MCILSPVREPQIKDDVNCHTFRCVHTFTLGLTYEIERPFSTRDFFLHEAHYVTLCQLNLSPEAVIICWYVRVCVFKIRGDVLDGFRMHDWQVVYSRWHWKCNPIMCFKKMLISILSMIWFGIRDISGFNYGTKKCSCVAQVNYANIVSWI